MLTLTSPHRTWAHGLPAGWKLGGLAGLTVVLFLPGPGWSMLAFAAGTLAAGALVAGALDFLGPWLRLLRPLWPFALLILIWHLATGTPLAGALILLRMAAAVGAANLVTMTTPLSDMQAVFLWLARPLSPLIAPGTVALAMALVVRFLPVMLERERILRDAWTARSPRRPGWRLVVPMTLAALDDAERVAEALRARGGAG
jgi:biotin transport system permease protein